ncbi:MAG: bifunctional helix-turn-helix domain-containing protein/methylated-DNA--[protein]-cysteine S-methyltransferase [Pseudomonadota bacterium]
MADALSYLGDNWRRRPSLADAAKAAGLSEAHFQREFTRWAGISPKQYASTFAHTAAGEALRAGETVEAAADAASVSAPSRLHDLFIAHEALSPGEAKSGGDGVAMTIGRAPTPFGDGVYLIAPRGLSGLGFIDSDDETGENLAFRDLTDRYPAADIRRDDKEAERWAAHVFETNEPTPLALYGTPWRRQVWRALLDIPAGHTVSYGEIADKVCTRKASRAVGAAIGANPVSWLIPCHRAISADGRLNGYHWGLARKRVMLAYESALGFG